MERDVLALYSRKCKTCKHLDPEEEVAHEKCHFEKGNSECPAKEVQFAVVGEAKRFADHMRQARAASDLPKQQKLLGALQKRSPAFQRKYEEWLAK